MFFAVFMWLGWSDDAVRMCCFLLFRRKEMGLLCGGE